MPGCVSEQKNIEVSKPIDVSDDAYETVPLKNDGMDSEVFLELLTESERDYVAELQATGGLKIATRLSDTVYDIDPTSGAISGFHYHLAKRFTEELNLQLNVKVVKFDDYFRKNGEIPEDISSGTSYQYKPDLFNDVDVYSDNMTVLPWRMGLMSFVDIAPVTIVTLSQEQNPIERPSDMSGKVYITNNNTSYKTELIDYIETHKLDVEAIYVESGDETVRAVALGEADFTVKDSNKALGEMQKYSKLKMGISISEIQTIGWAVSRENTQLESILSKYIDYVIKNKELDDLWKAEYGITLREYSRLLGIISDD